MYTYVPISDVDYRWYFDDPKVGDEDLKQIRPLAKECCSKLWSEFISDKHQHLAWYFVKTEVGDEKHWIYSLKCLDYNWEDDWNTDNINSLGIFLNSRFDIPEDEIVLFFWMKKYAVETKWGVFLRNWINFLYEDEAPVLFIKSRNTVIVFRPRGVILAGQKE